MGARYFTARLRSSVWAALALNLALMTGCATDVISPENPLLLIPDRSLQVKVGAMGRGEVRQALGEPRFSSSYWRFDLFRADTEQSSVVVAVTPWPVPFAKITDQLQRYTLVSYDANDRVSALATGVFRRPAPWRNLSPIRSNFGALHLRADDLLFFADPEGARHENLLVTAVRGNAYLALASKLPGCTAVFSCGERGCPSRLAIDGAPARRLPLHSANLWWLRPEGREGWLGDIEAPVNRTVEQWLPALVAITLPAGEHWFEVSAGFLTGETSFRFSCAPGAVLYLEISAARAGSSDSKPPTPWRLEVMAAMPEHFMRRPLVVLDDGQWLVDH